MKPIRTMLAAALAATLATSCVTYHYMTTEIHPDLTADRTVYAKADSAFLAGDMEDSPFFFRTAPQWSTGIVGQPFPVDFYDEIQTMDAYATAHLGSLSECRMTAVEPDMEGCPVLSPEESVDRHFRWFFTKYDYKATYRQISDLPVPLSEYLDEQQQHFFFRGGEMPRGWNGIEAYSLLDEMNTNFIDWYRRCTYKVSYDIIHSLCDSGMKTLMEQHAEKCYSSDLGKKDDIYPETLCKSLDTAASTDGFSRLYSEHREKIEASYREKEKVTEYFCFSILSEVKMPGKIVKTNADASGNGTTQWKIDCFRLLYGDLTLEATSRKANVWAFAMTFLILAAGIYMAVRKL